MQRIEVNLQTGEQRIVELTAEEIAALPPPAPPAAPTSITPRQARLALLGAGLLDAVQAAFAQLPEPQRKAAQIEWEFALAIERNSPLVAQFAPMLGLTEEQIDALFIAGAAL